MFLTLIALFGLIIGSFLNVCIWRLPLKQSVTNPPRSYCPQCEHKLSWFDNIPVLSWLLLRAHCRYCQKSISGQYPLVELLSALAAGAAFVRFGLTPTGIAIYVLLATLIVITFIDFEHKIIPDLINFPGMIIGLVLSIVTEFTHVFTPPLASGTTDSLLGMLIGGGGFYAVTYGYYLFSGKIGLGGGDIKFMGFVGALLGVRAIFPTIVAGSICGSVVGIALMLFKKGGRHTEIPFGPWLALGVVLYLFGQIPQLTLF
jgi:leader peptidase (prepilin peptidase)/N-methyltransferase